MSGSRKARAMAETITHSWLKSNYMAFQRIGHMVEKYDARYCGKVGGGGEYTTQVLSLVATFSHRQSRCWLWTNLRFELI